MSPMCASVPAWWSLPTSSSANGTDVVLEDFKEKFFKDWEIKILRPKSDGSDLETVTF